MLCIFVRNDSHSPARCSTQTTTAVAWEDDGEKVITRKFYLRDSNYAWNLFFTLLLAAAAAPLFVFIQFIRRHWDDEMLSRTAYEKWSWKSFKITTKWFTFYQSCCFHCRLFCLHRFDGNFPVDGGWMSPFRIILSAHFILGLFEYLMNVSWIV